MGITFLLANDGCRGSPRDDSLPGLNDKLLNKGHASDDIKYIAVRCAVVGGGEDSPIGGIPYIASLSNKPSKC